MNESELYKKLIQLKMEIQSLKDKTHNLEAEYMYYVQFDLSKCIHDYTTNTPGKCRKYCLICNMEKK